MTPSSTIAGRLRAGLRASLSAALLTATLVAVSAAEAAAAEPELVTDVNTGPANISASGGIGQLTSIGRRVVFVTSTTHEIAGTYDQRVEWGLWSTEGHQGSTRLLQAWSSSTYGGTTFIAGVVRGRAIVQAPSPAGRLWATDGTPEGTVPLVSPALGIPNLVDNGSGGKTASVGGRLLFPGCTGSNLSSCELWATDGSPAGTGSLGTPWPTSSYYGVSFVSWRDKLYFFSEGRLVATDGTAPGTAPILGLGTASNPRELTATADRLFFFRGSRNSELWTSDGTAAGTRRIRTFRRVADWGPPAYGILAGTHRIYFNLVGPDRNHQAMATSDGSEAGTGAVTRAEGIDPDVSFIWQAIATFGDRLLFADQQSRFWITDGSAASTRLLTGCPGGCPTMTYWGSRPRVAGVMALPGKRADVGNELFATDGTGPGTRLVLDACAGPCDGGAGALAAVGGRLLLSVWGPSPPQIWSSDLTAAGTRPLAAGLVSAWARLRGSLLLTVVDANWSNPEFVLTDGATIGEPFPTPTALTAGSYPRELTPLGDRMVFAACDEDGMGPFVSDGTPAGTQRLGPGVDFCGFGVGEMVRLGDAVYYLAAGRLYRTDGTPQGTAELLDTGAGPYELAYLRRAGNHLLALTNDTGNTVTTRGWVSDGTAAGTVEFLPPGLSYLCNLVTIGDRLYFTARDPDYPENYRSAVYRTDGTLEGTVRIADAGSDICGAEIVELGGDVYLLADGGMWRTDGTPQGTQRVLPSGLAPPIFGARNLVAWNGFLYFLASDDDDYPRVEHLYRSNGTGLGTVQLAPLGDFDWDRPDPEYTPFAGRLYFRAEDAAHGDELWSTDGTSAGTRLALELAPGAMSSGPHELAVAGGRLWFAADDGDHGIELWSYDGTAARSESAIAPLAFSSWPTGMTAIGYRLFFAAEDGVVGAEPWTLSLQP